MANITFSEDDLELVDTSQISAAVQVPKSVTDSVDEDDEFFQQPTKPVRKRKVLKEEPTEERKLPAVVAKMRAIFGADSPKITYVPLYMNDDESPVFTVGLREVNRQDFEWVVNRFRKMQSDTDTTERLDLTFETLMLSMAIVTLDEGAVDPSKATPVWRALDIVPENEAYVRDPMMPHISIRNQCADMMFDILFNGMNAFVSTLNRVYNTQVSKVIRTSKKEKSEAKENPTTR